MRSIFTIIVFILISASSFAQVQLSGKVTDSQNNPLPGANVFLQNSYDGTTSDSIGHFSFKTNPKRNPKPISQFYWVPTVSPEAGFGQRKNNFTEHYFAGIRRPD